ncbi:MAG: type II toxin-antitoxin system death-on-curing family toxin [Tepidisphaeraceae bacterium]
MTPRFLTRDQVVELHRDLIETYGGSHGIRDAGLLDSALAAPESSFGGEYLHGDLAEMAAAYLFHLAQNHAFVDGNKRIGAAGALVFLHANGLDPTFTNEQLVELTLGVASGGVSKSEVAKFVRRHAHRKGRTPRKKKR